MQSANRARRSIVNNLSSLTMCHTVDQGGQRCVPDQRGQLSARYRLSLQVLYCREDALNNHHCNSNKYALWFSMFGPPHELVTVNGPQYVGQPYEDMCSKWNIKHTTTSPRYHQSNGLIEGQVRTVKGVIQKCAKTGNDMLIALQQHRCTPLDSNLSSLSEIMFNRPIRTTLPSYHPTLMHQNQQLTNEQLHHRRDRMIRDHDQRAGPELPALHTVHRVDIFTSTKRLSTGGRAKSSLSAQSHVRTLCKHKTAQGYAELDHT